MNGIVSPARGCAVLLFIALLINTTAAVAVTRHDYTKQECAICHITWLDAFRLQDETVITKAWEPAVIEDTIAVVSSDDMCYSCHDGFIMDSRERVWEGKGHSVGKKPSETIRLMETMPLDRDGAVYCGTCHTPHGIGEQQAELTGSFFLRIENVDSAMCLQCHVRELEAPGKRNHSVNILSKRALPEEIYWMGGRLGSDPRRVICQSCHATHGKDVLLKPQGDSALCLMCHQEKGGRDGPGEEGRGLHPVGVVPREDLSGARVSQYGAKWGTDDRLLCLTCHAVHDGRNRSLVVDPDMAAFCQGCHENQARDIAGSKHNLLKTAPKSRNVEDEVPEDSGECRVCHRAHGWAQAGPSDGDRISSFCLSCHREDGSAPKKTIGLLSHPVDVHVKGLPDGSPLKLEGAGDSGKVLCGTCHDSHGSTEAMLREESKAICRNCHPDHFNLEETKHDLRRRQKHKTQEVKKRAAVGGPCFVCHSVHNARYAPLWAFVPAPDAGPGSALCGGCHNSGKIAREKPMAPFNHPLGVPQEKEPSEPLPLVEVGPDGSRNLVACQTCHNPHQWSSDGSKPGTAGEEGAPWNSYLRIPDDDESRLCTTCHADQKGVGRTDHDMQHVFSGEGSKGVEAVTLCSGCHLVHSDDTERRLWTRGLAREGKDEIAKACLGCHTKGKVAEKKAILSSHTMGGVPGEMLSVGLPLASDRPGEPGEMMTCSTCHDAHRWSSGATGPGDADGVNPEGTGEDSFLRVACTDDSGLCRKCHGGSASVIGTTHDLRTLGEKLSEDEARAIHSGGVCSACHGSHNFPFHPRYWAREPGEGENDEERLCFSCHREGGLARDKIPGWHRHPDVLIRPALDKLADQALDPVGNQWDEGRISETGIHCSICHDPHQWSLDRKEAEPGEGFPGDIASSYLREKSHRQICSVCHGIEGLYRYSYFHQWKKMRKPGGVGEGN